MTFTCIWFIFLWWNFSLGLLKQFPYNNKSWPRYISNNLQKKNTKKKKNTWSTL